MFRKSLLSLALGLSALVATSAHAAALNNGDRLTISAGVPTYDANGDQVDVVSGSWFGLDANVNGSISGTEKVALSMGTTGLVIGAITFPGASHSGCPVTSDTNAVDAPWCYQSATGSHYVDAIPVTGSTAGLDMRGWNVTWNGLSGALDVSRVWGAGYSAGLGNLVWDGNYGNAYTLDFHAYPTCGDPSGFCDEPRYALHLEGTVVAVPEASSLGMMLAGLGLISLGGVSRRKRAYRFSHSEKA